MISSLERKIKIKNLRNTAIYLIVTLIAVILAFANGFSFEAQWKIGLRGTDFGIPIPNILVSGMFLLIGVITLLAAISCIKDFFKNKTYNEIVGSLHELGDFTFIDQTLSNLPKSKSIKKGDLRYNELFFCYVEGTNVFLVPTNTINSIEPLTTHGKKTEYFLKVRTQEKSVSIPVKQNDLVPLADNVSAFVRYALTQHQQ